MYLTEEMTTPILAWQELFSWVTSMPKLHILFQLRLVSLGSELGLDTELPDVSATDTRGQTALYIASLAGDEDDIRVPLEAVAELHALDNVSKTPMDYAVEMNRGPFVCGVLQKPLSR